MCTFTISWIKRGGKKVLEPERKKKNLNTWQIQFLKWRCMFQSAYCPHGGVVDILPAATTDGRVLA